MTGGMTTQEDKPRNRARRISNSSQDSNGSGSERYLRIFNPALERHLMPDRGISSAPHSRAGSVKRKPRPKELDIISARQRTNSLPTATPINLTISVEDFSQQQDDDDDDEEPRLHRVRSFTKTKGGLVNRGDSFKRKSNSNLSNAGSIGGGSDTAVEAECSPLAKFSNSSQNSSCVSVASLVPPSIFRVLVMGAYAVGKTALCQQFMTSEYMGASDTDNAEGDLEKTVSVLVDGEESTVYFMDAPQDFLSPAPVTPDGYVVVFSITDRKSFDDAVDTLFHLRQEQGSELAIIFVANKTDLVRKRTVVTSEARSVAEQYDCKFVETSAAINHNVDELLVGVVSQLRIKRKETSTETASSNAKGSKPDHVKPSCVPKGAKGLLYRLLGKKDKAKSCDNLYT